MGKQCPSEEALAELLNEPRGEEWADFEQHMSMCASCQHVVAFATAFDDVRTEPEAPVLPPEHLQRQLGVGQRLGRFLILKELGAGAFGVVFEGTDTILKRPVAIKLLSRALRDDPNARARLLSEARSLARLQHPNVASIYEVGETDAEVWLAMERVKGEALPVWRSARFRDHKAVIKVFLAAARALAAAHEAGIVHRDFKPDNVVVGPDGEAKVIDFGLARGFDTLPDIDEVPDGGTEVTDMTVTLARTRAGRGVGTPAYMAPEILAGGSADPASDQFSYFVSFFEALTGSRPFAATNLAELRAAQAQGPPAMPGNWPRWLSRLVTRGLAKSPARRHPSMRAVAAELAMRLAPEPPLAGTTLGALLVIGCLSLAFLPDLNTNRLLAGHEGRRLERGIMTLNILASGRVDAIRAWRQVLAVSSEQDETLVDPGLRPAQDACLALRDLRVQVVARSLGGARSSDPVTLVDVVGRAEDCVDSFHLAAMGRDLDASGVTPETLRDLWSEVVDIDLALANRDDGKAVERGDGLARRARSLHLDTVEAAALLRVSRASCNNDKVETCLAALDQALQATTRSGDLREQLSALIAIIYYYGGGMRDRPAADLAVSMASGVLTRLGNDHRLSSQLERAIGTYALARGDTARARVALLKADADATLAWGAESPGRTSHLFALARLAEQEGDLALAKEHMQHAVSLWERAWGPDHPGMLVYVRQLARTERLLGDFEGALATARRALSLNHSLDPTHIDVLVTNFEIGEDLLALGRLPEAELVLVDLAARAVRSYGNRVILTGQTYVLLALCRLRRDNLEGAEEALAMARTRYFQPGLRVWMTATDAALAARKGDRFRALHSAVVAAFVAGPMLYRTSEDLWVRRLIAEGLEAGTN